MKFFLRHIFSFLLLSLIAALSSFTHATVIDHLTSADWNAFEDGFVTFDSTTGLEWLDISRTAGNSIVNTEAAAFFGTGTGDGTFRWATSAQIVQLFDHVLGWVALDGSSCIPPASPCVAVAGDSREEAELMIGLFGGGSPSTFEVEMHGVSRASQFGSAFGVGLLRVVNGILPVRWDPGAASEGCCFTEDQSVAHIGSWLVRDRVPVPEPSTFIILGLGVLWLGNKRRKLTI